jgi:transcriptional regulator with XRE-family HTH domain
MRENFDLPPPPPLSGPAGFGGRLRQLRHARRMYQHEVAKKLKVTQHSLSTWENGSQYPNYWNLIEIAHFFNADIGWLTGMQYGTNDGGSRYDRHQCNAG